MACVKSRCRTTLNISPPSLTGPSPPWDVGYKKHYPCSPLSTYAKHGQLPLIPAAGHTGQGMEAHKYHDQPLSGTRHKGAATVRSEPRIGEGYKYL